MNIKTLGFKAAIATAVVAGAVSTASAAKAFSVGDILQFSSTDTVKFDFDGAPDRLNFGNNFFDPSGATAGSLGSIYVTPGSTGAFAPFVTTSGSIKDLALAPATSLPLANFIKIGNISFDLKKFTHSVVSAPGAFDTFQLSVEGVFKQGSQVLGEGLLTAQFLDGQKSGESSYSGSFLVTKQIPTPALLPGLIGLGMGVLRKRKKEMAAANAEA